MRKCHKVLLIIIVSMSISFNVSLSNLIHNNKVFEEEVKKDNGKINKRKAITLDVLLHGDMESRKRIKAIEIKKEQERVRIEAIKKEQVRKEISRGVSIEDLNDEGWFDVELSFYTNDFHDCGKSDGITKSGKHVNSQTIATPENIEFGTNIYIKGQGIKVAEDIGGAIQYVYYKGIRYMKIDVFVEGASQRELNKMGIVRTVAKIIEPEGN